MPQTLTDAIRRVRSIVDEPATPSSPAGAPHKYSDTEITDWVNDGLRDVSRRAEDLITYDTTITVPAYIPAPGIAAPTYPLLGDVIRIQRIEFIPANAINQVYKLEPSTQNEMDQIWGTYQQNPASYPQWWVTRGYPGGTNRNAFVLQIYPVPSQNGTLNLYYRLPYRFLDPVANAGEYNKPMDIIEGWDDSVVDYASYKALQKAKDPEWKDRKTDYEEKITQMIDVTRKFHDQASFMTYGTMYQPAWLVGGSDW
jgi:hypothetical protein